jgi:long-chain acyl-CoA synthetase
VHRDEKLVALIYPDHDAMVLNNITKDDLPGILEHYRKELNATLPSYMNVSRFEIHQEEFIKTPKRSIKRFLYS